MSEAITRQIEGVCEGVMMKSGGWHEYHINIGQQYPVKLATKQEDVQLMAAAAGSAKAVWTFSESDGNPNPHQPGKFFKNRYLSNVAVGGTLDPALAGQQSLTTTQPASSGGLPSSEGRERSIERQTIVKASMPFYPADVITTDEQFFALIRRLDGFMVSGYMAPPTTTTEVAAPAAAAPAEAGPGEGADDDIPF